MTIAKLMRKTTRRPSSKRLRSGKILDLPNNHCKTNEKDHPKTIKQKVVPHQCHRRTHHRSSHRHRASLIIINIAIIIKKCGVAIWV